MSGAHPAALTPWAARYPYGFYFLDTTGEIIAPDLTPYIWRHLDGTCWIERDDTWHRVVTVYPWELP